MNPSEVVLEFSADFAKGTEKVDYALHPLGEPTVLIEAKSASRTLSEEAPGQLQRYFLAVEAAEYAVYTNGIHWHWYRAIPGKQRLEQQPLLSLDVTDPQSSELDFLYHVSKDNFDLSRLNDTAEEIVATRMCLQWINSAKSSPLDAFIKTMSKEIWGNTSKPSATVIRNTLINIINQKFDSENLEGNGTDQFPISSDIIVKSPPQPYSRINFSDSLDTGDGLPTMHNVDQQRAWRIRGKSWHRESSGRKVLLSVISYIATQDAKGSDNFYRNSVDVSGKPLFRHSTEPIHGYYQLVSGIWTRTILGNDAIARVLQKIARQVITKSGKSLHVGADKDADIQVWLPFGKKKKRK